MAGTGESEALLAGAGRGGGSYLREEPRGHPGATYVPVDDNEEVDIGPDQSYLWWIAPLVRVGSKKGLGLVAWL